MRKRRSDITTRVVLSEYREENLTSNRLFKNMYICTRSPARDRKKTKKQEETHVMRVCSCASIRLLHRVRLDISPHEIYSQTSRGRVWKYFLKLKTAREKLSPKITSKEYQLYKDRSFMAIQNLHFIRAINASIKILLEYNTLGKKRERKVLYTYISI